MEKKTRILIVEDDMIIAANISLQLSALGYEVIGIESRGEEAITHAKLNTPDIVLMDINLKGTLTGIETVKAIQSNSNVPIIYLTANSDEATFSRAKETRPEAFISKPFNKLDLQRTIALVAERSKVEGAKIEEKEDIRVLKDRIFVRHHGQMVKLLIKNILYIEADRNYCNIITNNGKFLIVSTLKTIERKLKNDQFLRVHRSFVINLSKIDVLADSHLEINRKVIPISRSHKEQLLSRLQTI